MGDDRDRGAGGLAEFLLNGIAVGEGGFGAVEKVRHYVLALLATVIE